MTDYITREELLREIMSAEDSAVPDAVDDTVLDDIITDASRAVDHYCARQFYASGETLYLDVPEPGDRMLWLGKDVVAVSGASNGDGTALSASDYYLWPRNASSYIALMLKDGAAVNWVGASSGNTEAVIAVAASVGYVDRAASAGRGSEIVRNTRRAALIKAMQLYRGRHPSTVETRVIKDADWQALVDGYVRRGY